MEELAKDVGVSVVQDVEAFRGIMFAINVDCPEQVDTTIEKAGKQEEKF